MSAVERANVDPTAMLEMNDVSIAYGETVVVRDVSLRVVPGEVLAIIGPNGAGKTTILNGVVGLADVVGGSVNIGGAPLVRPRLERMTRLGVAYVPQGRWLFPYSDGMMNLWSGGYGRRDRRAVEAETQEFIASWPIAARVAHRRAAVMSGGEQQVVAIGRGVISKPRLLLIDEPSLGLAPILVKEVVKILANITSNLSGDGAAVVIVEQNVEMALEVANRVCVLVGGQIRHEGPTSDLSPEDISEFYLH